MKESAYTLWLTGLSGAGKTTLACALADALAARNLTCELLDGDVVRQNISPDLGFSREDRGENIRRVAQRCQQLNDAGKWTIAALISPYRVDRELARGVIGQARFVEIYLATPLSVCEARDPKGLYERARTGAIKHFTGVSDPYEAPLQPDLSFDAGKQSVAECVGATLKRLGLGE